MTNRPAKDPSDAQRLLNRWQDAVPNDRLAHLVKDVTRAFVRALQTRLAQHGVSFGHWTFLRILWEGDGLTQRELSDHAGVMEPTTFAAIKAMEALGYVQRVQRADNKRKVYIHLTPMGQQLKAKLVPLAEEVNAIGARGTAAADIARCRQTLLAVLENLARDEVETSSKQRRIPVTPRRARQAARPAEDNAGRSPATAHPHAPGKPPRQ